MPWSPKLCVERERGGAEEYNSPVGKGRPFMSAISTRLLFFVLSIYVNRYYSFQLPVLNWGGVHSTATRSKIILNTVQYFENEFYRRGFVGLQ